jgi:Fur family peroxide stress response transcriptional regulator
MGKKHYATTLCPSREAQLRRALEKAGCRFTRQRAAVYDFLSATTMHPTAEQVFAAVRQTVPNISLATVYKALDALCAANLAAKLADGTGTTRYDGHSEPHYHLRCLKTGEIRDLPLPYDPDLIARLAPHLVEELRRQGFQVIGHRLELVGRFDTPSPGPLPPG